MLHSGFWHNVHGMYSSFLQIDVSHFECDELKLQWTKVNFPCDKLSRLPSFFWGHMVTFLYHIVAVPKIQLVTITCILLHIEITSQHVASLRVVLTLFTLGAVRLCGVLSHATPSDTAAVGRALYAKRSDMGHPCFNM